MSALKTMLIKNIAHLVTCDDNDSILQDVNIYIENGVIKSIGKETPVADTVIDGAGMVCYPGLVNTHHHLYQILTRNLPSVQNLELFDWLVALYEIWKFIDEDAVYNSTKVGLTELAKCGCTTVSDHHYVFPKSSGDLLGAQFSAAEELGVRMAACRGSMSLSKKDGGLPPDTVVQTTNEILTDSQRAVERFHDSSRYSMKQVVLAPCSPFSVTDDLMRETAILARSLGVRMHTHLAETKDEEVFVLEKTGMRPLEYMESLGWIGSDVWYAHGIYFNSEEIKHLAKTGTGIAHCPASNMKLSSGICKVPELLKAGVPLGLAVDGSASNDGSNLLEEMRIGYLLHRLQWGKEAPTGYDMLKMATKGSASILGRNDIGHIAPNMAADMFLVDTSRIELAGSLEDISSMLATVGLCGSVDMTIVNGKVIVDKGRMVGVDEEELSRQTSKTAESILEKSRV